MMPLNMFAITLNTNPVSTVRGRKQKKLKYRMKSVIKRFCQVCRNRATRQYFGVLACKSCKNFYRHSIIKGKTYTCTGDNEESCAISFRSLSCHRCHLIKCESSGMSKLVVKLHRKSQVKAAPIRAPTSIRSLTNAYFKIFKSYGNNTKTYKIKPLLLSDAPLEKDGASYKAVMFSQLCSHYEPLLHDIVRFAHLVPGFADLPHDDQLILLKTGFIDVWLILNASRLAHVQDSITLFDGTQIPICEITAVYTKDYVTSILDFSDECRALKLRHTDRAILIALALVCPDRPNLLEEEQVKNLRASILSCMQSYMQLVRPNCVDFHEKATALLSNIYDIGKQHSLLLNVYRAEIEKLSVTPVITELFDLHSPHTYKEA